MYELFDFFCRLSSARRSHVLLMDSMIWAAVVVGKGGDFEVTQGKTVGLFVGLLVVHGILVRTFFSSPSTLTSSLAFYTLTTLNSIIVTTTNHE